jgi:hypothetical protein
METLIVITDSKIDWKQLNAALIANGDEPVDLGYGPPEKTIICGHVRVASDHHYYVFYSWEGIGDDEQGMLMYQMYDLVKNPKYMTLLGVKNVITNA